ncbi:TIGR02391 family protein [Yinghuangia sp. YIM S10712]|uniref:TIGR02391 family protein n=1 Tax=Yinghuangia sp. YIM S10712 TaxID=3436930 RepID=UPI003F52F499
MTERHRAAGHVEAPGGPDGTALLEAVWAWFLKKGAWPSWQDLQRLRRHRTIDPKVALAQLPDDLLVRQAQTRAWIDGRPSGQLRLTPAALVYLRGADVYLQAFFDQIDLLAEIQRRQAAINGQPATVSQSDLYSQQHQRSQMPNTPSIPLDAFVYHEPWCVGGDVGSGWAGTETTIVVDDRIQKFVGTRDIIDYWQRRREFLTTSSGRRNRPAADTTLLGPVHSDIEKAAGQLYADAHYSDAVLRAFKVVEHRVQQVTGSDEIGQRLMNSAFGGTSPKLDIARTPGPSSGGERDGYRMLYIGAMVGIRNVRAHGEHSLDDADEARDAISFASLLMRRIDWAVSRPADEG